jgi:hypothetical protein
MSVRDGAGANPRGQFDPASQWAIKRFLIKLTAIVLLVETVQRPAIESILIFSYVNVVASLVIAVVYRECNDGPLNHWDEAAAFTALCALAHGTRALLG